jgi:WD40 repeat protein
MEEEEELAPGPPEPPPADPRVLLWKLDRQSPDVPPIAFPAHSQDLTSIWISGDSRWLVTVAGVIEDSSMPPDRPQPMSGDTICLWDLRATSIPESRIALLGSIPVSSTALAPGGNQLVACDMQGQVYLWQLDVDQPAETQKVLKGHQWPVKTVAFRGDGRVLATGSGSRGGFGDERSYAVRLWDLTSEEPGSQSVALTGFQGPVNTIDLSPDGKWAVTTDGVAEGMYGESRARLWNLHAGDGEVAGQLVTATNHPQTLQAVISPDSRWLVTVNGRGPALLLWDLHKPIAAQTPLALISRQLPAEMIAVGIAFGKDSRTLQLMGIDGVRTWSLLLDDQLSLARQTAGRDWTPEERQRYLGGVAPE